MIYERCTRCTGALDKFISTAHTTSFFLLLLSFLMNESSSLQLTVRQQHHYRWRETVHMRWWSLNLQWCRAKFPSAAIFSLSLIFPICWPFCAMMRSCTRANEWEMIAKEDEWNDTWTCFHSIIDVSRSKLRSNSNNVVFMWVVNFSFHCLFI